MFLSWFLFLKRPDIPAGLANGSATRWIGQFWKNAFGFDWLYDRLFVRPFVWLAQVNRNDVVDWLINLIPLTLRGANSLAAATQTGNLRWYAFAAGAGAVALIAAVAIP